MTAQRGADLLQPASAGRAAESPTTAAYAMLHKMVSAHTADVMTAGVTERPDGEGPRSTADVLALRQTRHAALGVLARSHRARRRGEDADRAAGQVLVRLRSTGEIPDLNDVDLVRMAAVPDESHRVGVDQAPGAHVPPCSFDGGRPLLEMLHRISAQDLMASCDLPRPRPGGEIHAHVELRLLDDRVVRSQVMLVGYKTGFGVSVLVRCPRCGRRVRLLYMPSAGGALACDACTGATRFCVRHGHSAWYRHVLGHLRRAAVLRARAAQPRIRRTTRRHLFDEAQVATDGAVAGLVRLGFPADDATAFEKLVAPMMSNDRARACP